MNVVLSLKGIAGVTRPGQGISDTVRAGFRSVLADISQGCGPWELENAGTEPEKRLQKYYLSEEPDKLPQVMEKLTDACRKRGLSLPVAYAPYLPRNTERTDLRELLKELSLESIRYCGQIGSKYIVIRPLFAGIDPAKLWEANREYYLELAKEAEKQDVMILLENQSRDYNGHLLRGICSDPAEAAEWIDRLNRECAGKDSFERFGFCFDIGTCTICGQDPHEMLCVLGKRVKAVLLRDCDGVRDQYYLPMSLGGENISKTDWLGLFRGLRKIDFDGELILCLCDTAASVMLKPALLQYAKSVADYFVWQTGMERMLKQYSKRVLFGAGNMCRAYMKCYGKEYPPLFTCDNDPTLWGTVFEGLEVKNPEALKELPEDCAVFICNMYYREIEAQLEELGVHRPIEFFNDEYMPTFYFDRLERKTY